MDLWNPYDDRWLLRDSTICLPVRNRIFCLDFYGHPPFDPDVSFIPQRPPHGFSSYRHVTVLTFYNDRCLSAVVCDWKQNPAVALSVLLIVSGLGWLVILSNPSCAAGSRMWWIINGTDKHNSRSESKRSDHDLPEWTTNAPTACIRLYLAPAGHTLTQINKKIRYTILLLALLVFFFLSHWCLKCSDKTWGQKA